MINIAIKSCKSVHSSTFNLDTYILHFKIFQYHILQYTFNSLYFKFNTIFCIPSILKLNTCILQYDKYCNKYLVSPDIQVHFI